MTEKKAGINEAQITLPPARDFAPVAVRRAIRAEALTHPATLYPAVTGILGGLAWALFGSPILLAVAFGGGLLGLAGLTVNYFFRDKTFATRYVEQLKQQVADRERSLLESLGEALQSCSNIAGAEEYAQQASAQFVKIQRKYESLMELLEQKLGSGELALGGVWAVTEQVYLGVLENLRQVEGLLGSIATIDPAYIDQRLERLSQIAAPDDADVREAQTLLTRKKLREDQLQKVNELLTENEEALTQLEEATVAMAGIESFERFTTVNTLDSVKRLRELAASIYDKR